MRWLRRLWVFRNTFQTRLPLTVRPMFSSSQDQIWVVNLPICVSWPCQSLWLRWALTYQQIVLICQFLTPSIHVLVLQMTWFQVSRPSWLRWWRLIRPLSGRHLIPWLFLMSWDVGQPPMMVWLWPSLLLSLFMTRWGLKPCLLPIIMSWQPCQILWHTLSTFMWRHLKRTERWLSFTRLSMAQLTNLMVFM